MTLARAKSDKMHPEQDTQTDMNALNITDYTKTLGLQAKQASAQMARARF